MDLSCLIKQLKLRDARWKVLGIDGCRYSALEGQRLAIALDLSRVQNKQFSIERFQRLCFNDQLARCFLAKVNFCSLLGGQGQAIERIRQKGLLNASEIALFGIGLQLKGTHSVVVTVKAPHFLMGLVQNYPANIGRLSKFIEGLKGNGAG